MAEVAAPTYLVRPDAATGALQLVRYDGFRTERPVVDNVVDFHIDYFGDPSPPRTLALVAAADPPRPSTTYGPAPLPPLPQLAPTPSPVPLDPAWFRDGPWCPDAAHAARYDADLLRIRRVRLRLRVQVAVAAMRGPAGRLFAKGGTSTTAEFFAPDQQFVLDVTPRNLGAAP